MVATKENIEELFKKFKYKYFQGKLPKCELDTHYSFKHLGRFTCYRDEVWRRKPKFTHKKITISRCYDFTDEELQCILLHEMVHLYLLHTQNAVEGNVDHGELFMTTISEMNEKYGLNIKHNYDYTLKRAPGRSVFLWWLHNQLNGLS